MNEEILDLLEVSTHNGNIYREWGPILFDPSFRTQDNIDRAYRRTKKIISEEFEERKNRPVDKLSNLGFGNMPKNMF